MSWLDYQRSLRDVLLAESPSPAALAALGHEPWRWEAYRRMVRSRFYQVIDHAFERLIAVAGADRFHALVDRFLAVDPPQSPYLRDLPGEFLRFAERHLAADLEALAPFALDLLRFEWAELDAAYSHEEVRADDVEPLEMERVAVLSPALRLVDVGYAVHRVATDGSGAPATPERMTLCLYRDRASHEVETLELTPVAATMLRRMADRNTPLTQIVRNAAEVHHVSIDVAFVDALSTLLADLTERGVLLGSQRTTEKSR